MTALHRVLRLSGRLALTAQQSRYSGGMVALLPDDATVQRLTVTHPLAEDPADLHLTLAFLGENVTKMSTATRQHLLASTAHLATTTTPVDARVFGHAMFNPDDNPCAVYLCTDGRDGVSTLASLHQRVRPFADLAQHAPFCAHVTAGYGVPITELSHTGPVRFDRMQVALAGVRHEFPLRGTSQEVA